MMLDMRQSTRRPAKLRRRQTCSRSGPEASKPILKRIENLPKTDQVDCHCKAYRGPKWVTPGHSKGLAEGSDEMDALNCFKG
jgi:hypothetical protein